MSIGPGGWLHMQRRCRRATHCPSERRNGPHLSTQLWIDTPITFTPLSQKNQRLAPGKPGSVCGLSVTCSRQADAACAQSAHGGGRLLQRRVPAAAPGAWRSRRVQLQASRPCKANPSPAAHPNLAAGVAERPGQRAAARQGGGGREGQQEQQRITPLDRCHGLLPCNLLKTGWGSSTGVDDLWQRCKQRQVRGGEADGAAPAPPGAPAGSGGAATARPSCQGLPGKRAATLGSIRAAHPELPRTRPQPGKCSRPAGIADRARQGPGSAANHLGRAEGRGCGRGGGG